MSENVYSESFLVALDGLLELEGGYANHWADSGGKTRYGVTERVAREHGYTGDMRGFPLRMARKIYYEDYWSSLSLDAVNAHSEQVATELFDSAVNVGAKRSGRWLQRALNALNREGKDYMDLIEDGRIGPKTLSALSEYLKVRSEDGEHVLYVLLNCIQGAYYLRLTERRQKDEAFLFGWIRRRVI